MPLQKWNSNDLELVEHIQGLLKKFNLESQELSISSQLSTKVLGLVWQPPSDVLTYSFANVLDSISLYEQSITKRELLSVSSRIFDPVGLLSPFTVNLKILYQSLWQLGLQWDQSVPPEIHKTWIGLIKGLELLETVSVPRYCLQNSYSHTELEIHLFSDASMDAFGTVAYLRNHLKDGSIHVQLLTSRTRVAPKTKSISIPRLELLAALLSARLVGYLSRALKEYHITYTLWTDSTAIFYWIRGDGSRWKPFVKNRVEEIRKFTTPAQWRFCSGRENPADLVSRGTTAQKLLISQMWWHGPHWLQKELEQPGQISLEEPGDVLNETRTALANRTSTLPEGMPIFEIRRYGTFSKTLRVTAWVFRFLRNMSRKAVPPPNRHNITEEPVFKEIIKLKNGSEFEVESLSTIEVERAERFWIRSTQMNAFKVEFDCLNNNHSTIPKQCRLAPLRPFFDPANKLIRVKGRLDCLFQLENKTPPAVLPCIKQGEIYNRFVELLIRHVHFSLCHAGVETVIAELRERFWICKARQQVKAVLSKCVQCRKATAKHYEAQEAPLPIERLNCVQPFEIIGIDFAGPLYVQGLESQHKAYICLFTCAVTRGVHLELVWSLETDSFIMCLSRFFARRGVSRVIYSDNAKTFKASAEILTLLQRSPTFTEFCNSKRIIWRFIPPASPWWGGFWERMVRTTKNLLKRTLGTTILNIEEITTFLAVIEQIINLRPLFYASEEDPTPVAPIHLISGQRLNTIAPVNFLIDDLASNTKPTMLSYYRNAVRLSTQFWMRFRKMYLSDLRRFSSPAKRSIPIQVGDIVNIHQPNQKRVCWPTGIVCKLFVGKDGKTRMVQLRTSRGMMLRPIQKLYPFEVKESETQEPSPLPCPKDSSFESASSDSRGEYVGKEADGSEEVRRKEGNLDVRRTLRGREVKRPKRYSD